MHASARAALPLHEIDARSRPNLVERVKATLAEVIARAETIGCEIVIENIEDKDPRDRVRLAKALESNKVRVSLDIGHASLVSRTREARAGTQDATSLAARWAPALQRTVEETLP